MLNKNAFVLAVALCAPLAHASWQESAKTMWETAQEKGGALYDDNVTAVMSGIQIAKDKYAQLKSLGSSSSETTDKVTSVTARTNLKEIDLGAYNILIDCNDRAASAAWMDLTIDKYNLPRYSNYFYASALPKSCQPKTLHTFSGVQKNGLHYDVGHFLGANSFDYSRAALHAANDKVNTAPQVSTTNRAGTWREVEKIMECRRTADYIGNGKKITVIAGPVWGNDKSDDYFYRKHGVKTPDAYYKIAIFTTQQGVNAYAWMIPNKAKESKNAKPDDFLVSPENIIDATGLQQLHKLIPDSVLNVRAAHSPKMVPGCDLS